MDWIGYPIRIDILASSSHLYFTRNHFDAALRIHGHCLNLLCGYGGQLSLGYAAFTGMGAYTTLLLYRSFDLSPWLGMLLGGILSTLLMAVIAYPCFRFGIRGAILRWQALPLPKS